MHTTSGLAKDGTEFHLHHNSDFSGNASLVLHQPGTSHSNDKRIELPGEVVKALAMLIAADVIRTAVQEAVELAIKNTVR